MLWEDQQDSKYQFQELPPMVPLHDPVFQQVIRMIPINGICNFCDVGIW